MNETFDDNEPRKDGEKRPRKAEAEELRQGCGENVRRELECGLEIGRGCTVNVDKLR
jgi:hypothetical protein